LHGRIRHPSWGTRTFCIVWLLWITKLASWYRRNPEQFS
jgi:hypothetical protein